MSNLFSALTASRDAMDVVAQALDVTQNNVNNASVTGYARQRLAFESRPFAPASGLSGGVSAGAIESARDQYADAEVHRQLQGSGSSGQLAAALSSIAANFDATGETGIPAALSRLLQGFTQWSADPNSLQARGNVVDAATGLARSFQQTAAPLETQRSATERQLGETVTAINNLASRIRGYNAERAASGQDAGLDANLQSSLEQLSELVDITAATQADGTVTVLMGGQTPLVIGVSQYALRTGQGAADPSSPYPGAVPAARILDSGGQDVTDQVAGGKLAALLDIRNRVLPSLIGDPQQAGDLNRLAAGFADRVNQLLSAGQVSGGPPPQSGQPLFVYDAASAARSLAVSLQITPGQLAAIYPGPPYSGNGTALKLAVMGQSGDPADSIDGVSFVAYYGAIAARVGGEVATAKSDSSMATEAVAQARSLRDRISGASLDEEAISLIHYQRSYQATARMIAVLSNLTETTLQMLP